MPRVLVIDDEPKIADFVSRALSANGLSVDSATDGARGLELARSGRYDLVVLDLMMPGVSGMGVLRGTIEAQPQQRVLVLSALGDVDSKVRCLEVGAADYLTKPFALAELVARVWARLRQPGAEAADGLLRAGGLTLDPHRPRGGGAAPAGGGGRRGAAARGGAPARPAPPYRRLGQRPGRAVLARVPAAQAPRPQGGRGVHARRAARGGLGLQLRPGHQRRRRLHPPSPRQARQGCRGDRPPCRLLPPSSRGAGLSSSGASSPPRTWR